MSRLRSQIGWLLHGQANTVTTLESLSVDLRALQEKVAAMELRMREAEIARAALAERQLAEFDRVRDAVARATDDLSARISRADRAALMDDSPEARLARWTERDAAIGLAAEAEQLRAALAAREQEIANLRERTAQLGNRVVALELERNQLAAAVARAQRPSIARRLYRKARSVARRLIPG